MLEWTSLGKLAKEDVFVNMSMTSFAVVAASVLAIGCDYLPMNKFISFHILPTFVSLLIP